jgi:hypothetical protein
VATTRTGRSAIKAGAACVAPFPFGKTLIRRRVSKVSASLHLARHWSVGSVARPCVGGQQCQRFEPAAWRAGSGKAALMADLVDAKLPAQEARMGWTRWLGVAAVLLAATPAFGEPGSPSATYPTGSAGTAGGGAGGASSTGSAGTGDAGGGTASASSSGCSWGGGSEARMVTVGCGALIVIGCRRRRVARARL